MVVLAAALCGVVSMAATESEIGRFDTVIASDIFVENDKGQLVIVLSTTDSGNNGLVSTYNGKTGKELVSLNATVGYHGTVTTYAPTGKESVELGATSNGGRIEVSNKTGEVIVSLDADDYGNGEVGAWNRKGEGRVWRSR